MARAEERRALKHIWRAGRKHFTPCKKNDKVDWTNERAAEVLQCALKEPAESARGRIHRQAHRVKRRR